MTPIYSCTDEFIPSYETSIIHTALTEPVAAMTPEPADPADPSLPPDSDAGGCATGGGSRGGSLIFVVGELLAVSRRRRSRA